MGISQAKAVLGLGDMANIMAIPCYSCHLSPIALSCSTYVRHSGSCHSAPDYRSPLFSVNFETHQLLDLGI